ncbi:MAG: hypothetical protein JWM58_2171 [Rhizobium sp.]|nr:hypothetical protein [Rhizobium sp.]
MTSKTKTASLIGLAALATLTLGTATAFAEQHDDRQELQRLESSKMSLAQAVQAAEAEYKGKAVSASLDMKQPSTTFVVEVMSANGTKSVWVDTETGKLTALVTGADEEGDNEGNGEEDAD